ncbi:hypothetical protein EJ05DRAFT_126862 [Pseudovirgaria hyperparasitica]|uniref:Pantetheine-phosphate adenylyltransferase family protein-like protein n=1 Tax=Pseudovirgaria hyperparasitica TaxID=470096 RepID=A0A6A6W0X7_9PEZI|nr:uncharacterized protein EJ05DRAFT_126862 [Pseudovirgaria hyperparasitica]KAF2755227.1 hypothetical protein EJ05DRAFT_126862 [Pseudovirgaria hyperparasitica]
MPPIKPQSSLVLLPPAPSSPTYENLKAAYNTTLLTILRDASLKLDGTGGGAVLEIALPCPHLYGQEDAPRSTLYEPTQRLLANLYKLICVVCARGSINIEDVDGVDVRLILVAYPRNGKLHHAQSGSPEADAEGPVVTIQTLARSGRVWNMVYAVETEAGEQILRHFTTFHRSVAQVTKVRGGIVQVLPKDELNASSVAASDGQKKRKHASVAVGGTFDHLHIGHKLLLSMTAFMVDRAADTLDATEQEQDRTIIIGITGDELLQNKKYAEHLESWSARQQFVDAYMRSILDFSAHGQHLIRVDERTEPGPNGHVVHVTLPSGLVLQYVEIWDPFGPTITDQAISALVLSGETRRGGAAVNSKREEKAWLPLEVFEVDVLDAEEEFAAEAAAAHGSPKGGQDTFQSKLSSTEIRKKLSEKGAGRNKM